MLRTNWRGRNQAARRHKSNWTSTPWSLRFTKGSIPWSSRSSTRRCSPGSERFKWDIKHQQPKSKSKVGRKWVKEEPIECVAKIWHLRQGGEVQLHSPGRRCATIVQDDHVVHAYSMAKLIQRTHTGLAWLDDRGSHCKAEQKPRGMGGYCNGGFVPIRDHWHDCMWLWNSGTLGLGDGARVDQIN